ncbi:hypothetical protein [Mycolicibacterium psychrotolerans]|uniref:Lipoprotein n=1 Tax=Mycolicibacterium psychrotolerans TaxID=216929 RepID=A0A7I7M4M1_9MYCO|nr:hypothetical protein [Mycolicibacterium psychrotolerans]BBX66940.1 hypothetical protein MPSYJ_04010 [Mycolicibacterium psychrotolerans]
MKITIAIAALAALLTSGCFFHDIDEIAQEAVNESMDDMRASQSASATVTGEASAPYSGVLGMPLPEGFVLTSRKTGNKWTQEEWSYPYSAFMGRYPNHRENVTAQFAALYSGWGWTRCPGDASEAWTNGEATNSISFMQWGGSNAQMRALTLSRGHCETRP